VRGARGPAGLRPGGPVGRAGRAGPRRPRRPAGAAPTSRAQAAAGGSCCAVRGAQRAARQAPQPRPASAARNELPGPGLEAAPGSDGRRCDACAGVQDTKRWAARRWFPGSRGKCHGGRGTGPGWARSASGPRRRTAPAVTVRVFFGELELRLGRRARFQV
jgi:hypothetical protein